MSDFRVPLSVALDAFGVPATVTRPAPDHTPIVTRGFWLSPLNSADPYGNDRRNAAPLRVFVLPRADVPVLPNGSRIAAPLVAGGEVLTWQSDNLASPVEVDEWRAIVTPAQA